MKKKLFAIAMILVFTVSMLSACKKDTNEGTDNTPTKSAENNGTTTEDNADTGEVSTEPVTLTVWESTEGPDEFIKQAGAAFTEKYPNITIEYVNVELGDAAGQIALDGPAGVGPDLFAAPHDKLGELVTGGHVLAVPDPDAVKALALPSTVSALTYSDGVLYGYPTSAETYAIFYNRALISDEEVPKTWEDLVTWSKKFNEENADTGKYPFVMEVGSGYYGILFTTLNGNRLFGPTGTDTTTTYLNTEDSIKGMTFFQSMREILDVPSADLTTAMCDEAFTSGNAAMEITGPWRVKPNTDAGIDFGVAPLPALPGETTPAASFSGTRGMYISAYSNHPTEASLFGQFLLSDEMQKLRFDITGALPSTNIEVDAHYVAGFSEQLKYAFPMPSIPQMTAFWNSINPAMGNIWDGADVKTELDALDATIMAQ